MRILSRYLLVQFIASSGAILLALMVTWVSADGLRRLDEIGESWELGLRSVALGAMDVFRYAVPIACIAGVVWTLTRATRNREITAIRAGGVPLRRALAPLLLGGAVMAIALGAFQDRILIPTRIALSRAPGSAEEGERRRPQLLVDRSWYASSASIFSAATYDPASKELTDVTVFQFDGNMGFRQRIDAERAVNIDADIWEFRGVHIHAAQAGGGIEHRSALALRMDLGLSGSDLERAPRALELLSLHKLARAIRELPGDPTARAPLLATFHSRLLEPAAVLILVLFAIPLALGDVERGDSLPRALLLALLWASGFWFSWTMGLQVAQRGIVPAFAPLWGVTLGALAVGFWRYRQIKE